MRPSLLYAPMLIALPGALARVMISFSSTSEDASLSIFGVNGPRTSLHFYTTGDHENPYVLTSADQDAVGMDTRLGLKPGHAAFTHTSDGKHVNCHIEGIPAGDLDADEDFSFMGRGEYHTWWTLASLSDEATQVCRDKGGMKLVCEVFDDKDQRVPGVQQACT
ncbi:uncharacterized protein MKK02DRAFT_45858 [Dioszegia hungarica]|uniref:Uncharacterized protein n=1 Tax=Dioszegia hungarica TaxID=4972 RepID=A0AA38HBN3_9TREE|nr:uncharacterized protein MKK02DRAFT_45858 [Dioszegia hungarica]KAI9637147.1 hypothetical protein MKK02DRAFT_45858 [Dioszegia hungarica]